MVATADNDEDVLQQGRYLLPFKHPKEENVDDEDDMVVLMYNNFHL